MPLRLFRVKIPGRFEKLVDKCMMHRPDRRLPALAIVLKELETIC